MASNQKIISHAKNQENVIHNQEKKSMKTGKEMTGIVELAERNFQKAIINRLSDLKKNLNIVKRNVENV